MNKLSLILLMSMEFAHAGMSGRDIMKKNEESRKLQDVRATSTITTTGGSTGEKVKNFTWWRKLNADQQSYNTLTRFHFPPEVKGEGILFLEKTAGSDNEVLLYLPAYKKIRRVENQQQSGSFMSSEFSYSDISTPHLEDYEYTLEKEEPCPEAESKTQTCFVIRSKPANEKVRERIGYAFSRLWVRKDNFMMAKGEHYDLEEKLFKVLQASQIQEVDKKTHHFMALHMEMENLKNRRKTVIQFEKLAVNEGLSDVLFTQQNLQKEK